MYSFVEMIKLGWKRHIAQETCCPVEITPKQASCNQCCAAVFRIWSSIIYYELDNKGIR